MATDYRVAPHVTRQLIRRGISPRLLKELLDSPQQILPAGGGRKAYHSIIDAGGGKMMLLRAIVDEVPATPVVVTVYRTSKIAKYWSAT